MKCPILYDKILDTIHPGTCNLFIADDVMGEKDATIAKSHHGNLTVIYIVLLSYLCLTKNKMRV